MKSKNKSTPKAAIKKSDNYTIRDVYQPSYKRSLKAVNYDEVNTDSEEVTEILDKKLFLEDDGTDLTNKDDQMNEYLKLNKNKDEAVEVTDKNTYLHNVETDSISKDKTNASMEANVKFYTDEDEVTELIEKNIYLREAFTDYTNIENTDDNVNADVKFHDNVGEQMTDKNVYLQEASTDFFNKELKEGSVKDDTKLHNDQNKIIKSKDKSINLKEPGRGLMKLKPTQDLVNEKSKLHDNKKGTKVSNDIGDLGVELNDFFKMISHWMNIFSGISLDTNETGLTTGYVCYLYDYSVNKYYDPVFRDHDTCVNAYFDYYTVNKY